LTLAEFSNVIGFKVNNGDVQKVNNTFSKIKSTATRVLGAIGIGLSLTSMNALVEEFNRVKDQIRNSTSELGNQAEIQQKILEAATATRSQYAQTSKVVSNLVKENKELFGNVDEAIKFNNAATMLFKTAGKTNEEIAGLMEAINKSFAKGKIDSETLNQLLERSPEAVELLNRQLGTTSDQLEKMAQDGKFTVTDLKNAFVNNADSIQASFGNVKTTITDAMTVIRNKWGLWLADTNDAIQLTQTLSTVMVKGFDGLLRVLTRVRNGVVWLGDKLGGIEKVYKLIALAAGAVFGVAALNKLAVFITNINKLTTALSLTRLKIVGIAAAVILLALLIEDFIVFMKGGDSIFGSLLEKAGIDADGLREKLVTVFRGIRDTVLPMWVGFCSVFKMLFEGIRSFWAEWGDEILGGIGKVLGVIANAIVSFMSWITGSEDAKEIMYALGEAIGVVAAAIAIAVPIIATLSGAISAVSAVIGFITSPVGLVVAAIAALITIIALLVKNWDKVKDAASRCWNWIKGVWSGAGNWFKTKVIDPIVGFFNGLFDGIVGIFQSTNWQSIVQFIINPFAGIFSYLYENFEGFRNFIDGIVLGVRDTVVNIKDSIVEGFAAAIEWIRALPEQALTWGKDIVMGIVNGIKNAISHVGDAVKDVADKIKSFLGFSEPEDGPLSNFHTYMPDMIDLMSKGIKGGREKIKAALNELTGDMALITNDGIANTNAALSEQTGVIPKNANAGSVGPNSAQDKTAGSVPIVANASLNNFNAVLSKLIGNVATATKAIFANTRAALNDLTGNHELNAKDGFAKLKNAIGEMIGSKELLTKEGIVNIKATLGELTNNMELLAKAGLVKTNTAGSVSNTTNNRSIVQNVEINNEFNGDRAIQQNAASTMDKSAGDVTAQLARGLAYAR